MKYRTIKPNQLQITPPRDSHAPTTCSHLPPHCPPQAVVTEKNVRFTILTDRLIRLEYSKTDQFEDRPSQAIWHREQPVPRFEKTTTANLLVIETDYLRLEYSPTPRGFTAKTLSITIKQTGVTWMYGAKQTENLKGTARTLDG